MASHVPPMAKMVASPTTSAAATASTPTTARTTATPTPNTWEKPDIDPAKAMKRLNKLRRPQTTNEADFWHIPAALWDGHVNDVREGRNLKSAMYHLEKHDLAGRVMETSEGKECSTKCENCVKKNTSCRKRDPKYSCALCRFKGWPCSQAQREPASSPGNEQPSDSRTGSGENLEEENCRLKAEAKARSEEFEEEVRKRVKLEVAALLESNKQVEQQKSGRHDQTLGREGGGKDREQTSTRDATTQKSASSSPKLGIFNPVAVVNRTHLSQEVAKEVAKQMGKHIDEVEHLRERLSAEMSHREIENTKREVLEAQVDQNSKEIAAMLRDLERRDARDAERTANQHSFRPQ